MPAFDPLKKSALISAALLTSSLAIPAQAEASLFSRLGIATPSAPNSALLGQGFYVDSQIKVEAMPNLGSMAALDASQPASLGEDVKASIVYASAKPPIAAAPKPSPSDSSKESKPKAKSMQARSPWANILKEYIHTDADLNRFDYAGLSKSPQAMKNLDRYIADLAKQSPSTLEQDEALAYWANLYNALTVQIVAQNWPVASIKEIKSGLFTPGPWKKELVRVEGRSLSLDAIEHGTMRAQFDEPRIHYMVNCASVGCPNLSLKEWRASSLEADLTAAAKAFVNAPRGASVKNGKLTVSSIYKWYKEDFGNSDKGVIAHLSEYADPKLKAELSGLTKISGDQYNWNVNAK